MAQLTITTGFMYFVSFSMYSVQASGSGTNRGIEFQAHGETGYCSDFEVYSSDSEASICRQNKAWLASPTSR